MDLFRNTTAWTNTANTTEEYTFLPGYSENDLKYIVATQLLRNICIPTIACIGLIGNTLSLLVFSRQDMRRSRCSVFLAALACVDNLFIASLLVTWIDGEWLEILTSEFLCQCNVFVSYICSFLSAWFIVCLTCERFIAIRFPFRTYIYNRKMELLVTCILTMLACSLYLFSFFTVTVQDDGFRKVCTYEFRYSTLIELGTLIDTLLTTVVPFVVIIVFDTMVLYTALTRKRTRVLTHRACQSTLSAIRSAQPRVKRDRPLLRVASTMLVVSITFLCLNLPSHIVRIYNIIHYLSGGIQTVSLKSYFIQELTLMIYYMTFCSNFLIYIIVGKNFKVSLRAFLSCRSTANENRRRLAKRQSSSMTPTNDGGRIIGTAVSTK